jgi:large subunit ribosomal protein L25
MEQVNLIAKTREEKGKQAIKHLRNNGLIPAVMYKGGDKNILLQLRKQDLLKILQTSLGGNVIISLKIDSETRPAAKKTKAADVCTVIIKEIQEDPLKNEILHVDFQQISLTESIKVSVPITISGEAVGVKRDGGILEHLLWEIEVECLPTNIPEKIEVEITALEIGQAIHIKDLKLPEAVKVLNGAEQIVLVVAPPAKEEKVEEKVEEVLEPEVIRQKKPEAVEEEPGKEKKQEEKK